MKLRELRATLDELAFCFDDEIEVAFNDGTGECLSVDSASVQHLWGKPDEAWLWRREQVRDEHVQQAVVVLG